MTTREIIGRLESLGSDENVAGMARFGIVTRKAFGVTTPDLKRLAKEIKKESPRRHELALELWETGIHEARSIAFLIDDPKQVTEEQMDSWARDFDNWATVDGACCYLFRSTPFAYKKLSEWAESEHEFIKRAAFSLIAFLAVHDKKADDEKLAAFLPLIEKHADDGRNFVKKAVNWALRQVGKRSLFLNKLAIGAAKRVAAQGTNPARWIAADALRELTSEKVQARLKARAERRKVVDISG